jgi:acylglycerol lipase
VPYNLTAAASLCSIELRRLYKEFLRRDDLPRELKCDEVDLREGYWANSRGMCLFTSIMKPKSEEIKAVVCFCHGFLGSSSYLIRCEYQRMVKKGIAFVTIDYEGHGQSDGVHGLIPSWDGLVGDALDYFAEVLQKEFPDKPAFLCGEVRTADLLVLLNIRLIDVCRVLTHNAKSMGGAVCFSIYEQCPSLWRGVVFQAPMCKIKEEMVSKVMVAFFTQR